MSLSLRYFIMILETRPIHAASDLFADACNMLSFCFANCLQNAVCAFKMVSALSSTARQYKLACCSLIVVIPQKIYEMRTPSFFRQLCKQLFLITDTIALPPNDRLRIAVRTEMLFFSCMFTIPPHAAPSPQSNKQYPKWIPNHRQIVQLDHGSNILTHIYIYDIIYCIKIYFFNSSDHCLTVKRKSTCMMTKKMEGVYQHG